LLKAKSDVLSAKYDGIATLHLAQTFRGVPYRFGGATPRAFDCSGYTQYVFGQLGYNLPHFAQSQYNWASPVPREKAGPGDFVFIHQPGGYVYHVGIYAGNGMMWHAPKPGGSVELSALFGNVTFGTVPQAKVDERFVAKVRILEAALAISKRHFPV
jgi:hypothetical protein